MTPAYVSLNGQGVFRARLVVPAIGIWHADVWIDSTAIPSAPGPQTLLFAGSAWVGATIRSVDFAGVREMRIVGGTAGWRKTVPPRQYQGIAGVPTAVVTSDLAASVLEVPPVLSPLISPTLGTDFLRPGGAAGRVLNFVLGDSWWMDPKGVIQTTIRPPLPVISQFDAIEVNGAPGRYEIATESPGDWMPGVTFIGPTVSGTVNRVMHSLEKGSLRTEVLAA